MSVKILITGPPRCGKSTLISKLINFYSQKEHNIYGFITPEVKKDDRRLGFDVQELDTKKRYKLARVGSYTTQFKLGKYHVFIEEFEKIISHLDSLDFKPVDIIFLDEIGKMELYSEKFQNFIRRIFQTNINIVATIGQKLHHPLKKFVLSNPNIKLFTVTRENQEFIYQNIIIALKQAIKI